MRLVYCFPCRSSDQVRAGATRDEIIEAGFMTVIMHGGSAYMYMVLLFKAVDEFITEATQLFSSICKQESNFYEKEK